MLDAPDGKAILQEVQAALKAGIAPGFQQAVAANALALVLREEDLGLAAAEAESARLAVLLGHEGTLAEMNQALCDGIDNGTLEGPQLEANLIRSTIEKMEIDQPAYPAFKAYRGATK